MSDRDLCNCLFLDQKWPISGIYTCIICVFLIICVLQIQLLQTISMKSYYIQQEEKQPVPAETISGNADIPVKKWKTFLAVLALIGAAFLIIKLQQPEGGQSTLQTVNTTAKDLINTPAKIKEEVKKKEPSNPASYLKATMSWRKKLIGGTVLEGTLHNSAPGVNFKDPVILVTWLSKTNTVIGTNRYPLDEYVGAGKTILYKLKVKAPPKIAEIKVSVETATVVK